MKFKAFIAPVITIIIAEGFKHIPWLNDIYTNYIYPVLFKILHTISSILPFSIYDILVVASILVLFSGVIFLWFKRYRWIYVKTIVISILWIYGWFYLCWGANYFGKDFYERTSIPKAEYDSLTYSQFLAEFRDSLNSTYDTTNIFKSAKELRSSIKELYLPICSSYNLPSLPKLYTTKDMLYPGIYAAVGVTGYYGPILSEIHINSLLLPEEVAFTTAHETAHLLGVTSEAEANLYGYLVTTSSPDKAVRFSGYFEIMPYILNNARKVVNDSTYRALYESINPEIFKLYAKQREHWKSLRREKAEKVQNAAHNTYLRVNKIPQGVANYSEVVALILSDYEYKRREY